MSLCHAFLSGAWLLSNLAVFATSQRIDGQFWPCNPTVNKTGSCLPNKGLASSTYTIDFTQQASLPPEWTISNYAQVKFGSNGAEFTIAKQGDAPQIWTNFMMLGCKYEIVAQIAPGTGVISSSVLISDDFDEIDFEFSGNYFNFSHTPGMGQNNYFGKGIAGNYDRGQWFPVAQPDKQFHTYSVDWTSDRIIWGLDGADLRRVNRTDCNAKGTLYQYPQTPSKLQLGIWDGGDPNSNWGTVQWAGGYTDLTKVPFTFYVKSVKITNYNPACAYNWTDQTGNWESVHAITDQNICNRLYGISSSTSSSSSIAIPKAASSTVLVVSTATVIPIPMPTSIQQKQSSSAIIATSSLASVSQNIGSSKAQMASVYTSTQSSSAAVFKSATVLASTSTLSTAAPIAHAASMGPGALSSSITTSVAASHVTYNFGSSSVAAALQQALSGSAAGYSVSPAASSLSVTSLAIVSSQVSHPVPGALPVLTSSTPDSAGVESQAASSSNIAARLSSVVSSGYNYLVSGAPSVHAAGASTSVSQSQWPSSSHVSYLVSGAPPSLVPSASDAADGKKQAVPASSTSTSTTTHFSYLVSGAPPTFAPSTASGAQANSQASSSAQASSISHISYLVSGVPPTFAPSSPVIDTVKGQATTIPTTAGASHLSFLVSGAPPTFALSSSAANAVKSQAAASAVSATHSGSAGISQVSFLVSGAPPTFAASSSNAIISGQMSNSGQFSASHSSFLSSGASSLFGWSLSISNIADAQTAPAKSSSSQFSFLVSGAPPTFAPSVTTSVQAKNQMAADASKLSSSQIRFLVSGAPPTFAPSPTAGDVAKNQAGSFPSTSSTSHVSFLVSGAPPTFAPSSSAVSSAAKDQAGVFLVKSSTSRASFLVSGAPPTFAPSSTTSNVAKNQVPVSTPAVSPSAASTSHASFLVSGAPPTFAASGTSAPSSGKTTWSTTDTTALNNIWDWIQSMQKTLAQLLGKEVSKRSELPEAMPARFKGHSEKHDEGERGKQSDRGRSPKDLPPKGPKAQKTRKEPHLNRMM